MSRIRAALCGALLVALLIPAAPASASSRFERAVIGHVNNIRASHGLGHLRLDFSLAASAQRHSSRQARRGVLTHGSPGKRLLKGNRRKIGETIAFVSRRNAARVVQMWMNSPGHRAVLLTRGFTRIGIGSKRGRIGGSRGTIVTADFAG